MLPLVRGVEPVTRHTCVHGWVEGPGHGGPARGYSWPPFQEGNVVRLRHGARSDKYIEPLARAFADVLLSDRPDLTAYPEAVAAWATAEARCDRLRVWTAAHGLVGAGGKVTCSHDLLMFEAQAARFRAQLGLDPVSDAGLTRARSEAVLSVADLESIRARGREIWARRRVEPTAVPPADAVEVADGD